MLPDDQGAEQRRQEAHNAQLARAYQTVFDENDPNRRAAVDAVLADLGRFCRSESSTFDADARVHALLEGRREVWLRLFKFVTVPEAEISKYVEVINE